MTKELKRNKVIKDMWTFLNSEFGTNFPYPDVGIYIGDEKECEEVFFNLKFENIGNPNEIEIASEIWPHKKFPAAVLMSYKQGQILGKNFGDHLFIVFLADINSIPLERFARGKSIKNVVDIIGFMNSYYISICHEFLHIIEVLTGNHNLLKSDHQILGLIQKFMKWNYKIMPYEKEEWEQGRE